MDYDHGFEEKRGSNSSVLLKLGITDRGCWDYLNLPPIKVYHLLPQDLNTQKAHHPYCQALQASDLLLYCGHPISSLSIFVYVSSCILYMLRFCRNVSRWGLLLFGPVITNKMTKCSI
uniref:Uncharacterized protein n=1 Tax=Micrurus spixii TaxID=129469 RepID=A0A2D4NJ70_9SAUR